MDLCADYVEWVLTEVDPPSDPGPILVSALGGTAASVIDPLASKLGWSITTNQWRPDDLPSWGLIRRCSAMRQQSRERLSTPAPA